ncbi:hypothetical protein FA13DRAFT_1832962 [Coprinellus micaceus]|uniref:Uncharacterized protein n=1 Tax=Coprinellus micaceus TaxID=71717 RepID=A0A4Y7SHA5_COPMI|nr:hypothetical protein FA13DRAFT_1832962 [Coprinellus micaceus]
MAPVSSDPTTAIKLNDIGALAALVRANPSMFMLRTILNAYWSLGTEHPSKADAYNTVLRDLKLYPDMPRFPAPEFENTLGTAPTDTFVRTFVPEFFDRVTSGLWEARQDMDTEVDPDNPFLIASMLSASAMKTEACFSSDQVWYIRDGLRMKGSDPKFFTPEEYEAGAVAGLIQVLSAGKRILEREMIEEGDLRQSLEDIGEVIKCSTGEKVLQAARELARNNFKESWSSRDIWALLDEE